MTRYERNRRLVEAYQIVAVELHHHLANGSEFLHQDSSGDAPEEVVELRFKVLRQVRDYAQGKANKLRGGR